MPGARVGGFGRPAGQGVAVTHADQHAGPASWRIAARAPGRSGARVMIVRWPWAASSRAPTASGVGSVMPLFVVRAAAEWVDERALDVDAEDAGAAGCGWCGQGELPSGRRRRASRQLRAMAR